MVYVTSDLHGYPLNSFLRLLETAGFGDSDCLYVLGDVVDRHGDGGVAALRKNGWDVMSHEEPDTFHEWGFWDDQIKAFIELIDAKE